MSIIPRQLIKPGTFACINRCFHSSRQCLSYEGEGKTTITVLNKNFDYGLMIDSISGFGFTMNNGIRILGPMITFPKLMLSWNISSSPEMNKESFALILNLEPKVDVMVIGLDDEYPHSAPFLLNVREIFANHKIPLEILPVHQACSTFNFLNSENRFAAAALIPPRAKRVEDLLLRDKDKQDKVEHDKVEAGPEINKTLTDEDITKFEEIDLMSPKIGGMKKDVDKKDYFKVRRPFRAGTTKESKQPHPPDKDDKST